MQYLPYGTEVELLHPNGSKYDAVVTGIAAIADDLVIYIICPLSELPEQGEYTHIACPESMLKIKGI